MENSNIQIIVKIAGVQYDFLVPNYFGYWRRESKTFWDGLRRLPERLGVSCSMSSVVRFLLFGVFLGLALAVLVDGPWTGIFVSNGSIPGTVIRGPAGLYM
jgi:hypothetical protein